MPSPAADIETLLGGGDRRSLGQSRQLVLRARKDPRVVAALIVALRSRHALIALRAADALEKITRENPASLAPFRRQVVAASSATSDPIVRWNLIQCLPRLPHSAAALRRIARRLEVWYLNDKSVIVRVSALDACVELARHTPSLEALARRLVADAVSGPSAAVRARGRLLAKQLTKSSRTTRR